MAVDIERLHQEAQIDTSPFELLCLETERAWESGRRQDLVKSTTHPGTGKTIVYSPIVRRVGNASGYVFSEEDTWLALDELIKTVTGDSDSKASLEVAIETTRP